MRKKKGGNFHGNNLITCVAICRFDRVYRLQGPGKLRLNHMMRITCYLGIVEGFIQMQYNTVVVVFTQPNG